MYFLAKAVLLSLLCGAGPPADTQGNWTVFSFGPESAVPVSTWTCDETAFAAGTVPGDLPPLAEQLPQDWDITDVATGDLTGDGEMEHALLVWRPWQDWPIAGWMASASPITAHQNELGESCHIILIRPKDLRDQSDAAGQAYQLVWAGSALARPVKAIALAEIDGLAAIELIALETSYQPDLIEPEANVSIWRWNGFGFSLIWRSDSGHYNELETADLDGDGRAELMVR